MPKIKRVQVLLTIVCSLFTVVFYFGIFANPNFNIFEFCMNLATEVLGLVVAIVIVDVYIREKKK